MARVKGVAALIGQPSGQPPNSSREKGVQRVNSVQSYPLAVDFQGSPSMTLAVPVIWLASAALTSRIMPRKKAKPKARMRTFNVRVSGHRTTVGMEPEIWDAFNEICQREDCTLDDICTSLNKVRGRSSLASALRVFIVTYFRRLAAEEGHAKAGHRGLKAKR